MLLQSHRILKRVGFGERLETEPPSFLDANGPCEAWDITCITISTELRIIVFIIDKKRIPTSSYSSLSSWGLELGS